MYVCICNGVTEDDVLNSVAEGARTTKAVRAACGMKPGCGTCTRRLCALVSDYRAAADMVDSITGPLPLEVVGGPPPREAGCGEGCDGACGGAREVPFEPVPAPGRGAGGRSCGEVAFELPIEPAQVRVREITQGGSAPQTAA
jgi:bacterioferritin-associated ferredoxin